MGVRQLLLRLLAEEHPRGEKLHLYFKRLGWEWHWEATYDALLLHAEGLREHLEEALRLLEEVVAAPRVDEPTVVAHARRLAEERRRAWQNPATRADAYTAMHVWGYSYAVEEAASPEAFAAVGWQALRSYCEAFLWRGLRHVVLASFSLPGSLLDWARWAADLSYDLPIPLSFSSVSYEERDPQAPQVSLRVVYPWVRLRHAGYGAYALALQRLGGYFGAQLMRSLREEAGLTYGVYARAMHTQAGSFFAVSSEVARDRAREAMDRIAYEIKRWHSSPFPEEAVFEEVRNFLLLRMQVESMSEWVDRMAYELARGSSAAQYVARMEEVASYRWETLPSLDLPLLAQVQVAVGGEEPIFAEGAPQSSYSAIPGQQLR
uniref:Peptidase M16 C-terminal domain-containing protein n=1 Tax=uncultured Bacteroidota bacterium TaxID=152509 RepID=H5SGI3_9BACT|nr:hypothetical protein HGMM_F25B04C12 [uncultured Bacteroidetes bacterium]